MDRCGNGFLCDFILETSEIAAIMLVFLSIATGLIMGMLYFGLFFGNRGNFSHPPEDLNQAVDFQWFKTKILVWAAISAGSGLLAYYELPGWFPILHGK